MPLYSCRHSICAKICNCFNSLEKITHVLLWALQLVNLVSNQVSTLLYGIIISNSDKLAEVDCSKYCILKTRNRGSTHWYWVSTSGLKFLLH